MVRVDFVALTNAFNAWAQESISVPEQTAIAVDDKSIKASVEEYDRAYQDFVAVVSAFCTQPRVVIGLQARHNGSESDITTVQTLLEVLQVQGVWMPCTPKKMVKQIIDSGNDYVIAVKKNQPKLYE